jgi:hypothetical protein
MLISVYPIGRHERTGATASPPRFKLIRVEGIEVVQSPPPKAADMCLDPQLPAGLRDAAKAGRVPMHKHPEGTG